MNALVAVIFLGILASLGSGLVYMMFPKARASNDSMARAMTVRVGLSVGLFGLLIVLWLVGVLEPHGMMR